MSGLRSTLISLWLLMFAGCDLREVVVPMGEPVLIVQAVLRPDRTQQYVIVERSFTGTIDADYDLGPTIPEDDGPENPADDAVVELRNLDRPADPCGSSVMFTVEPQARGLFELPGVYWSPPGCPTLEPGDRVELLVQTSRGERVTGLTTIPGMTTASLSVGGVATVFDMDSVTEFNRDRDTLGVTVEPIVGRLLQLEVFRVGELNTFPGEDQVVATRIFADSTSIAVPGDLIDVFERGGGEDVFRGGRQYRVTAALTDTNYYDFARSSNNPFTGRGFINRLDGGVGVFGSLVATSTALKVMGELNDQREGAYRLTGTIDTTQIDVELTLYLARDLETSEFSAFLDGTWITLALGAGGARTWLPMNVEGMSVDGELVGDRLFALVRQVAFEGSFQEQIIDLELRGTRTGNGAFAVSVGWVRSETTTALVGELMAVQQND